MSFFVQTADQMAKMLRNLDLWIDKAVAFAEQKEISPEDFLSYRLTPDMKPFVFQVQAAADAAKFAVGRASGTAPPKDADDENTIAELKERIARTLAFIDGVSPDAFAGAADRELRLGFAPGKAIRAGDYVMEFALPNFYFHVTTAYDLLRQSGVRLGKRDFIGDVKFYDAPDSP